MVLLKTQTFFILIMNEYTTFYVKFNPVLGVVSRVVKAFSFSEIIGVMVSCYSHLQLSNWSL